MTGTATSPTRIARALLALAALAGCTSRAPGTATVPGHFGGDPNAAYARFQAQVAAEPGAVRTSSGLVYRELSPGDGAAPGESETVTVRYRVTTPDGRVIEDSGAYGGAVTVDLEQIQPCMREAVLRMRSGGASRFVCPLPEQPAGERAAATPPAPLAIEVTLVAVGQPLPQPGH
jgi:FKBP-type peptidyl-prolyl cis-trans isomerase FkpA